MNTTVSLHPNIKADAFIVRPSVVTVRTFNDDAATEFAAKMQACIDAGQSVIPVVVASYGGAVCGLFEMLSAIEDAKARGVIVATYSPSHAMSCGSLLLAAGTKGHRYAADLAEIMVHQVSSFEGGKATDLVASTAEVERLNDLILSRLSAYCGQWSGYWKQLLHDRGNVDVYLTSDEARAHGMIDICATPRFNVRASVEMEVAA